MAVYVSVRGWVECDRGQVDHIKQIILEREDGHYSGGWAFPRQSFNWISYIFYGGDVQEGDVPWLFGQLEEIAAIPRLDEDDFGVRGLFLVTSEISDMVEWQVRDGGVHVVPAAEGHRCLGSQ